MRRGVYILLSSIFIFSSLLAINAEPVHDLFNSTNETTGTTVFSVFKDSSCIPFSAVKQTKEVNVNCQLRFLRKKNGQYFFHLFLPVIIQQQELMKSSITIESSSAFSIKKNIPLFLFNRQLRN